MTMRKEHATGQCTAGTYHPIPSAHREGNLPQRKAGAAQGRQRAADGLRHPP
jgi:hypothetical protein